MPFLPLLCHNIFQQKSIEKRPFPCLERRKKKSHFRTMSIAILGKDSTSFLCARESKISAQKHATIVEEMVKRRFLIFCRLKVKESFSFGNCFCYFCYLTVIIFNPKAFKFKPPRDTT